ncbi:hypothetical protein [Candidatus Poriferisocius sp.]|uniref:hypothetical protein n=1 Tax=Candidatus Poriferisocius sp. TaxID=3101276 RepID=UPI003B5AD405
MSDVTIDSTIDSERTDARTPGVWAWTLLRILLGWSFLWAFLDKMFGLGFSTCRASDSSAIDFGCDAAMINGGAPTYGFLEFGTAGSHTGFLFDWMAPAAPDAINAADVGFMAALLLGGLALMLGIGTRTAAIGGTLLLLFMFLAGDVWPEHNPVKDSHIVEIIALLAIAAVRPAGLSLQGWATKKLPVLGRIP